jgi:NADH dehydrogenase
LLVSAVVADAGNFQITAIAKISAAAGGTRIVLPAVIGDTASVTDASGRPAPGLASAAKQMGKYVGKLIAARVAVQSLPAFRYRHEGSLATIGRRAAVVELGRIQLRGFVGWMFWSAVHIYFLIGLRNRFVVAITWLWSYVTFKRGARLITEVPPVAPDE